MEIYVEIDAQANSKLRNIYIWKFYYFIITLDLRYGTCCTASKSELRRIVMPFISINKQEDCREIC